MLKMTRLPDVPIFRKNNGNGEVVEYGISGRNGNDSKVPQY